MTVPRAADDSPGVTGKGRIQVVDDDVDFAEGFAEFLETQGYEVRIANSATDALALAPDFEPEVALLDIRLGHTSGLDLIAALKDEFPDLACILMTGYADTDTAIEAVRRGATDYLRKPLDHGRVMATLEFCFLKLRLENEKRAAEQALRESEARYRTLVEASPDAIFVNREGRFALVNPGAARMFGAAGPDDLKGREIADFVRPADREAWALRNRQVAGGEPAADAVEEGRLRLDGSGFPAEAAAVPFRDGDFDSILSIERDISDRKAMEEWLREIHKMEALGQHTAGVAHEYNNLLAVIVGHLDFLREKAAGVPDLMRHVGPAASAADRGATLTRRLLAYSRMQALEPRVVDLNQRVTEMRQLLDAVVGETITTEFDLAADLAAVLIDPGRIDGVLLTLAANARDAMRGGGSLRLRTVNVRLEGEAASRAQISEGDYVLLSVSDTGVGMSADTVARAFDPFFTTKEVGKGTGLGLSMVYGFLKQTGGHAEIESEEGRGADVRLYLPIAPAGSKPD